MGTIKNMILLTSGFTIGFVTCGVVVVNKVINSESLRKALVDVAADKLRKAFMDVTADRIPIIVKAKNNRNIEYIYDNPIYPYKMVFFKSKEKAFSVLVKMQEVVTKHTFISVCDMHDIMDITDTFEESKENIKYGWTDLTGANVVPSSYYDYILQLPEIKLLQQ